jgi:hypothetical protein
MKSTWMFVNLLCVVFISGSAFGAITIQNWDFSSDASPAVPEFYSNEFGTPEATIVLYGDACGTPADWYPYFLGHFGVWVSELTTVTLKIPNSDVTGPGTYKDIWLTMGYRTILLEDTIVDADILGWDVAEEKTITPVGGWYELKVHWRITPNPADFEIIKLVVQDSGADVDYIYVTTECVPEPATMLLLGLGVLMCRKFKKA